jgi:NADH:ubiquinone oxidoreductase subunit H
LSEIGLLSALLSVLFTLFVVLTERKVLAYAMRRMGPTLMGRNGAFQIALDLFKLMTKETFLIPRQTTALAPVFLALTYACQLLFSQNFIWGPSMLLFENLDSMILYHLILILFGNIFFTLVGLLSQSRYAIIGTMRSLVHVISLDIFITIVYSLLVFSSQSVNFHDFVLAQNIYWFFFLYSPMASGFVILFLLESKRTPFDHAETESEVVAGSAVEYSGAMLLMIYLAEYLHLVISSVHFVLFFLRWVICFRVFFLFTAYFFNNPWFLLLNWRIL